MSISELQTDNELSNQCCFCAIIAKLAHTRGAILADTPAWFLFTYPFLHALTRSKTRAPLHRHMHAHTHAHTYSRTYLSLERVGVRRHRGVAHGCRSGRGCRCCVGEGGWIAGATASSSGADAAPLPADLADFPSDLRDFDAGQRLSFAAHAELLAGRPVQTLRRKE